MAEEEFQESEVIFEEIVKEDEGAVFNFPTNSGESRSNKGKWIKLKVNKENSVPLSIPENVSQKTWFRYVDLDFDGGDGEMVPPHVIIGRRLAGKMMAFSLCSGYGRTLKGRDLSEVRNSILRMTGFLET